MAKGKKFELVKVTYEMLKTVSPDKITIRDIADAAGCNSAVIYRHFDNLEHLLMIASVRFLEDYMLGFQEVTSRPLDPIEMEITMWKVFADCAFSNVDVFLLMFWGTYKEKLSDVIYEYYRMFPENWKDLNGLYTVVFFSNDLKERNTTILARAASAGYLNAEDVPLLSNLQCDFMHGMLMEYKTTYREDGVSEKASKIFIDTLISVQSHYRLR